MTSGFYPPEKVRVRKLTGSAVWGVGTWGDARWGQTYDTQTPVPVHTLTIEDGYTVEQTGALSIDPGVCTATLRQPLTALDDPNTVKPLGYGNRVEVSTTDGTILFQGRVRDTQAADRVETDQRTGRPIARRWIFTIPATVADLLRTTTSWPALPAENPLTRVRRFVPVNSSRLSSTQLAYVTSITMDTAEPGSATLLDVARAFTEATGIPLRAEFTFPASAALYADPASVAWNGTAPTPVLGNSEQWATEVVYAGNRGALTPAGATVANERTVFLSGLTTAARTAMTWGTSHWGSDRWGDGPVPVGLRPGDPINLLGTVLIVAHVSQTFGTRYAASVELTPPNAITT